MKRPTVPEVIGRQHLVPVFYAPDGRHRWHARLPNGALVFLGRSEPEVRGNLDALNRLAQLCKNRWRGVAAVSLTE